MSEPISGVVAIGTLTPTVSHSILTAVLSFFALLPFSTATWFVLCILGFFVWIFVKANKDPKSPVNWEDLIIDQTTGKVSPYKVGYLVGAIVSSWIVISFSDAVTATGASKLTFDILATYLTFLVGGIGVDALKKPTSPPPAPPADNNNN